MKKRTLILTISLFVLLLVIASQKNSVLLIIASLFAFVFAFGEAVNSISNEELKKLFGSVGGAYSVTAGAYEMPPVVIIGIILASFYALIVMIKIIIQGKFCHFMQLAKGESIFLRALLLSAVILIIAVLLAIYARFTEYIVLLALVTLVIIVKSLRPVEQ